MTHQKQPHALPNHVPRIIHRPLHISPQYTHPSHLSIYTSLRSIFIIQRCPPKAPQIKCENGKAQSSPSGMVGLVAAYVLIVAVDEDNSAARRSGRVLRGGCVEASVKRGVIVSREP